MKHVIFSALIAVLAIAGCSKYDFSVEPQLEGTQKTAIQLPAAKGLSIETIFSVSAYIDGVTGGSLTLNETYTTLNNQTVTISGTLNVPDGAYTGSRNISMTFNDLYAAGQFGPSGEFDIPLLLTLQFEGVDLSDITTDDVDFYYVSDANEYTLIEHDGVITDKVNGKLTVINAKLNHFSRYIFAR